MNWDWVYSIHLVGFEWMVYLGGRGRDLEDGLEDGRMHGLEKEREYQWQSRVV